MGNIKNLVPLTVEWDQRVQELHFSRQLRIWKQRKNSVNAVVLSLLEDEDPIFITLQLLGLNDIHWAFSIRSRNLPKTFCAITLYYPTQESIRELKNRGFVLFADHSPLVRESNLPYPYHSLVDGVSVWIAPYPLHS